MWTFFLPDECTVTLTPKLNSTGDRIICTYDIDDQPFMDWFGKLIVGLLGGLDNKNVRITPKRIEVALPTGKLPYRIKSLKSGKISITVKKK